jgi:hypothetical protein
MMVSLAFLLIAIFAASIAFSLLSFKVLALLFVMRDE